MSAASNVLKSGKRNYNLYFCIVFVNCIVFILLVFLENYLIALQEKRWRKKMDEVNVVDKEFDMVYFSFSIVFFF